MVDMLKGTFHSEATLRKFHETRKFTAVKAEKHYLWKGDAVGYAALHTWIKRRKKRPSCCEICGIEKPRLDLANISGKYLRDLADWEYLCRRCHMKKDGRLENMILSNKALGQIKEVLCGFCSKEFKQKNLGQKYCNQDCYHEGRKSCQQSVVA